MVRRRRAGLPVAGFEAEGKVEGGPTGSQTYSGRRSRSLFALREIKEMATRWGKEAKVVVEKLAQTKDGWTENERR